jgi:hypothetical protein
MVQFSYQKCLFGFVLEGHQIENVGIFYIHFEYFNVLWHILRQWGILCGSLVYFRPFWYVLPDLANLATQQRKSSFAVAKKLFARVLRSHFISPFFICYEKRRNGEIREKGNSLE